MSVSLAEPTALTWEDCMRAGNFSAAWEISDRVLADKKDIPCWHLPRHQQYIWRGEPLAGRRVLVRCYHGLGDTIQFARYLPLVAAIADELYVWAQPELMELLSTLPGRFQLLPLHDGTPEVDYEVDVEIMELSHVFRSTIATLPRRVPYLRVPASAGTYPNAHGPARARPREPHVGIVWESGSWNRARHFPLEAVERLVRCRPEINWHALQRGSALRDWRAEWGPVSGGDRPVETARAMLGLDLVISVDSFPAHLAGALGVRTWTVVPEPADWRWPSAGRRSPWYPTMEIFRQRRPGDWDNVEDEIAQRLAEEAGGELT